jgi:hypothetical protein
MTLPYVEWFHFLSNQNDQMLLGRPQSKERKFLNNCFLSLLDFLFLIIPLEIHHRLSIAEIICVINITKRIRGVRIISISNIITFLNLMIKQIMTEWREIQPILASL